MPKASNYYRRKPLIAYLIDWAQMQDSKILLSLAATYVEFLKIDWPALSGSTSGSRQDFGNYRFKKRNNHSKWEKHKQPRVAESSRPSRRHANVCSYLWNTLTDLVMREPWQLSVDQEKLICLVAGLPDERYGELKFNGNLVTAFKEKGDQIFMLTELLHSARNF